MPAADSVVEARGIVVPGQTAGRDSKYQEVARSILSRRASSKAKTLEQRYVSSHPFDELLRDVTPADRQMQHATLRAADVARATVPDMSVDDSDRACLARQLDRSFIGEIAKVVRESYPWSSAAPSHQLVQTHSPPALAMPP